MLDLPLILAGSLTVLAGGLFVYAKRHPVVADRWSRMHGACSSCHTRGALRDSGLCRACEHEQIAPMPDYE
jgi:hypothetical protein